MTTRALALVGLLAAPVALAEPCTDVSPGQVFTFEVPRPVPEPLRLALSAGRAYLALGAARAPGCAASAPRLLGGYVVAVLRPGRMAFSAPEGLSAAALRCLSQIGRRLRSPPALPKGAEVRMLWLLRPPAPPAPAAASVVEDAPRGKRSFTEIQAEVSRHLPAITSCLEALWIERPHAVGTLVLRLTIPEHGVVADAAMLRREPALAAAEECLLAVFSRLRLPARKDQTVMSYPLVITEAHSAAR